MVDNKNKSINHQSHPRQEGQQENIAPLQVDGQRNTENHSQAMSNMMQDSEEQEAGRNASQQERSREEKQED